MSNIYMECVTIILLWWRRLRCGGGGVNLLDVLMFSHFLVTRSVTLFFIGGVVHKKWCLLVGTTVPPDSDVPSNAGSVIQDHNNKKRFCYRKE